MSDELLPNSTKPRPLNSDEKNLLRQLLRIAEWPEPKIAASEQLLVEDMSGGMGSIRFFNTDAKSPSRRMKRRIAELEFSDSDGVNVIASLSTDEDDELFEIDIWKVDFGDVLQYPSSGRTHGKARA